MSSQSRSRVKGRSDGKPFLRLPRDLVESDEYAALSADAVKLMVDLHAQYRGSNNGDLSVAWRLMQPRGWRCKRRLYRARRELLEGHFIIVTRQGGRGVASLYALTYLAFDDCGGKLDVRVTHLPTNAWRKNRLDSRCYQIGSDGTTKEPGARQ